MHKRDMYPMNSSNWKKHNFKIRDFKTTNLTNSFAPVSYWEGLASIKTNHLGKSYKPNYQVEQINKLKLSYPIKKQSVNCKVLKI